MTKRTTEEHHALDVRELHRAEVLTTGRCCGWEWRLQGEVVASIYIEVESRDRLRLRYQLIQQEQSKTKDYQIPIFWTPCHLGGERPWFLCPCCGRRAAKLYNNGVFACRHCLRLNYRSQQANKRSRAADRSLRLRRALGCYMGLLSLPAEFIGKPKGMHWQTFVRKLQQLKQVDACVLEETRALLTSFTQIEYRPR